MNMNHFVLCFTAAAACSIPASAAWGFRYEFSTDNGATWGDRTIDVAAVAVDVRFRVIAYADPGTVVHATNGAGFAVALTRVQAQDRFTNMAQANGDSVLSNTWGEMPSGNANYTSSSFQGSSLLLGTAGVTSFALNFLTATQGNAFSPSRGGTPKLEWVVRLGELRVGKFTTESQHRQIVFGNLSRRQTFWYADLPVEGDASTNAATPDGVATDLEGTLTVVPAPAVSIAFVGLGLQRRRRVRGRE